MMYFAYKLNKQGDNVQLWHTLFPIWNQSVVPGPVLTVASWPAYTFLRRQVRWSGIPISLRIFHSLLWSCQSALKWCSELTLHNNGALANEHSSMDVLLKKSINLWEKQTCSLDLLSGDGDGKVWVVSFVVVVCPGCVCMPGCVFSCACPRLALHHPQQGGSVTKPGSLTQCAASQGLRHWGWQQRLYSHCSQERRWENWSQTHLSEREGLGIIMGWSCNVCGAWGKVSGNKEKLWSSSFCADITRPACPELVVLPCFEGGAPGPLTSKVTERTLPHAQWEGPLS